MVTLKHPTFGDKVTQEVEPEDAARWVASGWVCCGDRCPGCPQREPDAVILPVDPPKPGPRRKPTKR